MPSAQITVRMTISGADIIHETADLLFHIMVLLAHENIALNQVLGELESRLGLNGIEEKMTRNRAQ